MLFVTNPIPLSIIAVTFGMLLGFGNVTTYTHLIYITLKHSYVYVTRTRAWLIIRISFYVSYSHVIMYTLCLCRCHNILSWSVRGWTWFPHSCVAHTCDRAWRNTRISFYVCTSLVIVRAWLNAPAGGLLRRHRLAAALSGRTRARPRADGGAASRAHLAAGHHRPDDAWCRSMTFTPNFTLNSVA